MKVCIAKFNYFENCIPHLFIKIFYPDFIPIDLGLFSALIIPQTFMESNPPTVHYQIP